MKVIYKQILQLIPLQTISLPKNSDILSIQNQKENLCLWYLCNPDEDKYHIRAIKIYGTGMKEISEILKQKYLATIQMKEGNFIWHIFEVL